MKTSTLVAALAVSIAASGAAFAQEATYDYPQPVVSTKTRAQVQSELFAARADGTSKVWSISYNPLAMAKSERSRDSVKAERGAAMAHAVIAEDSGSFLLSRQQPSRAVPAVFALGSR